MTSRTHTAVLVPTPPNSLNALRTSPPPSKRQKISHDDISRDIHTFQFAIRSHGSSSSSEDLHSLVPLSLLPRSRLPLSWLDTCPGQSRQIPSGKLFVSNIPSLERDLQAESEPIILTARLVTPKAASSSTAGHAQSDELYVVERVKRGIYAVCALGSWVEEDDLLAASKGRWTNGRNIVASSEALPLSPLPEGNNYVNWLERARVDSKLVDHEVLENRKGTNVNIVFGQGTSDFPTNILDSQHAHAADEGECVELASSELVAESNEENPNVSLRVPRVENDKRLAGCEIQRPGDPISKGEQSPNEVLDCFRRSYLEALYISKTSVAYFAKGPLSRTRAAFKTGGDSSPHLPSLCNSYRDFILPMKKMDMKYRDTVPDMVRNLPLGSLDTNVAKSTTSRSKNRKAKKKLIGKNGLYVEEQEYIARWWQWGNAAEARPGGQTAEEGELKRLSTDLRIRETQLQILIILETMALELTVAKAAKIPQDSHSKPLKARKSQDLGTLLELLLDRLCIWHAVNVDDLPKDVAKDSDKSAPSNKPGDNDQLADFCTETVIPFYAARLPEKCKAISRKLGGPVSVPPLHPETSERKGVIQAQPGAAVKRTQSNKSRHTLQSGPTDEDPAPRGKTPSLLHSSTTSSNPPLKRESSEPVILSQIKSARGGIQKPRHLDNREVDLDTVAKQHETKLKKMNTLLDQKKELDEAINALRKPSRELVARDFADSVDKRSSVKHPRKRKNPVRNTLGQGIQVMATPKGSRKKDCDSSGLQSLPKDWQPSAEGNPPDDDAQGVPSSVSRPSHPTVKDSPIIRGDNSSSVFETPSKQPTQQSDRFLAKTKDVPEPESGAKRRGSLFRVPSLPNIDRRSQGSPTMLRKSVSNIQESGVYDYHPGESVQALAVQERSVHTKPPVQSHGGVSAVRVPVNSKATMPSTPTKAISMNVPTATNEAPPCEPNSTAADSTTIYDRLGWNDENPDDDDELVLL